MIKMLGHAASVLKQQTTPETAGDKATSTVDILQVILTILQEILALQGQSTPTAPPASQVQQENAELFAASVSILDSVKASQQSSTQTDVQVGGLQINILQLIIQIIEAILAEQTPTAPAPSLTSDQVTEALSSLAAAVKEETGGIHPLLTSDSITYTIDNLGRLTKLTYASGDTVTFNYDSVGNRTSVVTVL
jgi:YD repeat-containing protein